MMHQITNQEPKNVGELNRRVRTIHYKYKSGRQGEWFLTGFCPQKTKPQPYIDV